jgi:carboxymethylenebutenolidase
MLKNTADKLERTLERIGVEHDVREYPDAGHSFLNHHHGVAGALDKVAATEYHGPSADDAWGRILGFFDRHVAAR